MKLSFSSILSVLFTALIVAACGSGESFDYSKSSCQPGLKGGCQVEGSKGVFELKLESLEENQEYVFVVRSLESVEPESRFETAKIHIRSSEPSKHIPKEESDRAQRLKRQLPSANAYDESEFGDFFQAEHLHYSIDDHGHMIGQENKHASIEDLNPSNSNNCKSFKVNGSNHGLEPTQTADFSVVRHIPQEFKLCLNTDTRRNRYQFESAADCIEESLPILDRWLPAAKKRVSREVNILLTELFGSSQKTIGFFNPFDLFSRQGDFELPDSNKSEVVYISPYIDPTKICGTAIHEVQHLRNYQHKVTAQIPAAHRRNYQYVIDNTLERESLALDEGISHALEEIITASPVGRSHMFRFLMNPNPTSLMLEMSWDNELANRKTRGLSTLLVYFALNKAGAKLDPEDSTGQALIKRWVTSAGTGVGHLASSFGLSEDEFLDQFFKKLLRALYNPESQNEFIPPQVVANKEIRGLEFQNRDSEEMNYQKARFHPLLAEIPLLSRSTGITLRPQSFEIYRYIVSGSSETRGANLEITSSNADYKLSVIRVR